jgi:DNA-binding transcriptional LysR family regulator
LHIDQPALLRQIRALEEELRVQLFASDRRRTELTVAGEQLLTEARPLLAGANVLRLRQSASCVLASPLATDT